LPPTPENIISLKVIESFDLGRRIQKKSPSLITPTFETGSIPLPLPSSPQLAQKEEKLGVRLGRQTYRLWYPGGRVGAN
jgi:hypothetical protein